MTFLSFSGVASPLLGCSLALAATFGTPRALAQAPAADSEPKTAYPEVDKFAGSIKGTIWELRGTNTLKRLQYTGEGMVSLNPNGRANAPYDSAFVDVGVVRLNFSGPNTAWYFFSDDLKYVTPTTVVGELAYKLAKGYTPKPIKNFPADIVGQVWDSEEDDRNLKPSRLRWNGTELEVGVLRDKVWDVEKHPVFLAERRVLEQKVAPAQVASWYVFSADGTEAWMLHVQDVFGGQPSTAAAKAKRTPGQTSLKPQHNDLANFAEDLLPTSEQIRLDTIRRYFQRSLNKQPDIAKATHERLGGK
ncbi:hypothetical protein [Verrucomicrobium sp. BvORR034]|uniref:hypothetical protein n=1 Tax=Verrucomicrobium sp. BvORR034 TaxID=1396418 RepID=UPI000678C13F|nr:hypothetical protein [Verrucomicrobium sp. BvORR034]